MSKSMCGLGLLHRRLNGGPVCYDSAAKGDLPTVMCKARYSLTVLKVPLNPNQSINHCHVHILGLAEIFAVVRRTDRFYILNMDRLWIHEFLMENALNCVCH